MSTVELLSKLSFNLLAVICLCGLLFVFFEEFMEFISFNFKNGVF